MKKKLLVLGFIALVFAGGLVLASCDKQDCAKALIGNCYSSDSCIDMKNCGTMKSTMKTDKCDCSL